MEAVAAAPVASASATYLPSSGRRCHFLRTRRTAEPPVHDDCLNVVSHPPGTAAGPRAAFRNPAMWVTTVLASCPSSSLRLPFGQHPVVLLLANVHEMTSVSKGRRLPGSGPVERRPISCHILPPWRAEVRDHAPVLPETSGAWSARCRLYSPKGARFGPTCIVPQLEPQEDFTTRHVKKEQTDARKTLLGTHRPVRDPRLLRHRLLPQRLQPEWSLGPRGPGLRPDHGLRDQQAPEEVEKPRCCHPEFPAGSRRASAPPSAPLLPVGIGMVTLLPRAILSPGRINSSRQARRLPGRGRSRTASVSRRVPSARQWPG